MLLVCPVDSIYLLVISRCRLKLPMAMAMLLQRYCCGRVL